MATPAKYVYKRLAKPDEIRILELLPAKDDGDIVCCKIHHTYLSSSTNIYTALSYAWGSRKVPAVVVICHGYSAHIPPTLYSTLRRLRALSNTSQYLWADALCINQENTHEALTEKAFHIPMMHRIFARAEKVIADLGELDENEIEVLWHLNRYEALSEPDWSGVVANANSSERCRILKEHGLPAAQSDFWEGFSRFISRPWFTRVWIIQEFVLAKTVALMIGSHFQNGSFLQHGIIRAFRHLSWLYVCERYYPPPEGPSRRLEEALSVAYVPGIAVEHLVSLRNRSYNTGTFCEQLSASSALFKATDLRDKAYALLGLASDPDIKKDLVVDYTEDLARLMLRVSKYLGSHGSGTYPLYNCVGDNEGYVSWALNLDNTARDELSSLVHASGRTHPRVFKACGDTTLSGKLSEIRESAILLRGCLVDEVASSMKDHLPAQGEMTTPATLREHGDWLNKAYEWMCTMANEEHFQIDDFVRQCWRTVIADLIRGKGQEGLDDVRLRDWEHSSRCIDNWTLCHTAAYHKTPFDPSWETVADASVFGESLKYPCGRRLALTKRSRVSCLIPRDAREGDHIVVIYGCPIPFILRRKVDENGESFRIVGCAYVHGIMDGEAVEGEGSAAVRDIEIC